MRTLVLILTMLLGGGHADEALLQGLTLSDHLGQAHDLGRESARRLVLLFDLQARVDAKAWDDGTSPALPADRQLLRILDGGAIDAADRPRVIERVTTALAGTGVVFLLDWDGAVRQRLGAATAPVVMVACDAQGVEVGRLSGPPTAANRTSALALVHIVPDPPLSDRVVPRPKTDPKRIP